MAAGINSARRTWAVRVCSAVCVLSLAAAARPARALLRTAWASVCADRAWAEACRRARPAGLGEVELRLKIPEAGLDTPVIRGISEEDLDRYPCRIEGTGRAAVMFGHRDRHFAGLQACRPGMRVRLSAPAGPPRDYAITALQVLSPAELEQRLPSLQREFDLLLVTCFPFGWIGPAPDRLVVCATTRSHLQRSVAATVWSSTLFCSGDRVVVDIVL